MDDVTESTPDVAADAPAQAADAENVPAEQPPAAAEKPQPQQQPKTTEPSAQAALPPYCRSLLRVKVPLIVTLAQKRQPLGRILELGPGSLIQFEKSCEEMLDLDVAHHRVAAGEAVKVGDKFGLRITSLILPGERFCPVKRAKQTR